MHSASLLHDLAVVMLVAGLVTIVFHRLKQPVVLGYIVAGIIIGPHTPPFPLIQEKATIDILAELGVILLMFSLGLEFNLRKLKQVGLAAFIAAILEILLLFWLGFEIGRLFGWTTMDSIFLGAMLSMSSTTIIVKVLGELGKMKERFAHLIFGILILEDILGIAMIALLSGIAMTGSLSVGEVGVTLGRLGIFLSVALVVGLIFVPRLIGYVARFKSNEMLVVTVLALCFGVSLLAMKLGYSVALGAFVIGAVVAEAREIHRIEILVEPVRDMFSAIFFVAIGLMIDPRMVVEYWKPILVITLAVIGGKVVSCTIGAFLGGNDARTSLRVGMGLAQIGEFSFIIASLGVTLKVTSGFLYPVAVAVSVITTLLTPYLIRSADSVVNWFEGVAPKPLGQTMEVYTRWVGEIGGKAPSVEGKLARRWSWQIALNVAITGAVFIAAAYLGQRPPGWLSRFALDEEWVLTGLWLAAVLVALPIFVAILRKLQALGLLLAETRVKAGENPERTAARRGIVAQGIPLAGMLALAVYVLLLSSTLLPPVRVLFVLVLLVGLLAWLFWRTLIRLYAKAQIALQETLSSTPEAPQEMAPVPLMLREADTQVVVMTEASAATRKLIRELELRTRTGASIVAIGRNGTNNINPLPDEELLAGDQVLLLGTRGQIEAAKKALEEGNK